MAKQEIQDTLPALTPLMGLTGLQGSHNLLSALLQIIPFSPLMDSSNLTPDQEEHRSALLSAITQIGGGELTDVIDKLLPKTEDNMTDTDPDILNNPGSATPNSIENLARVITGKEKNLQNQHAQIDTKIDQLRNSAIAQSEVMVICPTGGESGARMYIHNPLPRDINLTFEPQLGGGVPESLKPSLALEVDASDQIIAPGSTTSLRLQVSLRPHPDWQTIDEVNFHINAIAESRTVSTIWVTVRVVN
tara:strand:- start:15894 stop:16637 length:744 start_codon:yes stop_codon:yes gene_type:complete